MKVPPNRPRASRSGPSGSVIPHADRRGVRLDVYIPEALAVRLDAEADRASLPRAEITRRALDLYLLGDSS